MSTPTVPIGVCPQCRKTVLVHWDLDPHDELIARCLHCDQDVSSVKSWPISDIERFGFTSQINEQHQASSCSGCSPLSSIDEV